MQKFKIILTILNWIWLTFQPSEWLEARYDSCPSYVAYRNDAYYTVLRNKFNIAKLIILNLLYCCLSLPKNILVYPPLSLQPGRGGG